MSSCGEAAGLLEKAEPVIRIEVLTFVAMVFESDCVEQFLGFQRMLKVPLTTYIRFSEVRVDVRQASSLRSNLTKKESCPLAKH